jgi:hypothetical protein
MAKKIIKGSSKLNKVETEEIKKPLNLINRNIETSPTSFRFTAEDMKTLNKITSEVNKLSTLNFSNTKILKTLIFIGSKTSPKKIYNAYKEIM